MRRIRTHGEVASRRPYPGLSQGRLLWLESELQRLLTEARASGVAWSSVVVHVDGDSARLRSRTEVAAELYDAGVRDLARRVERTPVPSGCFLGFVDVDGLTVLHAVSIAAALGEEDRHG